MTTSKMRDLFKQLAQDSMDFDSIEYKRCYLPDMHAFLILLDIYPETMSDGYGIISAAEHHQIYFTFDLDKLATVITEDIIKELVCCGIFITDDSLSRYV